MEPPNACVNFVSAKQGEVLSLPGGAIFRILEDGSRTDNRIATAEVIIPAKSRGPPPHWYEMNDETFLITSGTIRFHVKDGEHVDAKAGDYITIPPRAPYSFSNPFDEEAKFFNTFTPAYYINYFRMMDKWIKEGVKLDPNSLKQAMAHFATFSVESAL